MHIMAWLMRAWATLYKLDALPGERSEEAFCLLLGSIKPCMGLSFSSRGSETNQGRGTR